MRFSNLGPTFQGATDYFQSVINPLDPLTPACDIDLVLSILRLTEDDIDTDSTTYDTLDQINDLIMVATEQANKFTRFEHESRNIELRYDVKPYQRNSYHGLSPLGMVFASWVELNVHQVESVDSVDIFYKDGTNLNIDDFQEDLHSKPPRIKLERRTARVEDALASFRVLVTAGPGNAEIKSYQRAVALMAAYMYDNSNCSIESVFKKSGALELLKMYQLKRGL